jgi:uncharacterized lipoprotein YbaY
MRIWHRPSRRNIDVWLLVSSAAEACPVSVKIQHRAMRAIRSAQGQFQPRARLPPTRAIVYERIAIECADSPQERIGGVLAAVKSKKS